MYYLTIVNFVASTCKMLNANKELELIEFKRHWTLIYKYTNYVKHFWVTLLKDKTESAWLIVADCVHKQRSLVEFLKYNFRKWLTCKKKIKLIFDIIHITNETFQTIQLISMIRLGQKYKLNLSYTWLIFFYGKCILKNTQTCILLYAHHGNRASNTLTLTIYLTI